MHGNHLAVGGDGDSDFREIWINPNARTSSIAFFRPLDSGTTDTDNSIVGNIRNQLLVCKSKIATKCKNMIEKSLSTDFSQEIVFDGMKEEKKLSMLEFLHNLGLKPSVSTNDEETVIVIDISSLPEHGIGKSTFVEYLKDRIKKDCSQQHDSITPLQSEYSHRFYSHYNIDELKSLSQSKNALTLATSDVKSNETMAEGTNSSTTDIQKTISSAPGGLTLFSSDSFRDIKPSDQSVGYKKERHYFSGHKKREESSSSLIYKVGINSLPGKKSNKSEIPTVPVKLNSPVLENINGEAKISLGDRSRERKKTSKFQKILKKFGKKKQRSLIDKYEMENINEAKLKEGTKLCDLLHNSKIDLVTQTENICCKESSPLIKILSNHSTNFCDKSKSIILNVIKELNPEEILKQNSYVFSNNTIVLNEDKKKFVSIIGSSSSFDKRFSSFTKIEEEFYNEPVLRMEIKKRKIKAKDSLEKDTYCFNNIKATVDTLQNENKKYFCDRSVPACGLHTSPLSYDKKSFTLPRRWTSLFKKKSNNEPMMSSTNFRCVPTKVNSEISRATTEIGGCCPKFGIRLEVFERKTEMNK